MERFAPSRSECPTITIPDQRDRVNGWLDRDRLSTVRSGAIGLGAVGRAPARRQFHPRRCPGPA